MVHTFTAPCQPKSSEGSDDAEAILGEERGDFALGGIGSVDGELGARGCDDLLLFCTGELTQHCLSNS